MPVTFCSLGLRLSEGYPPEAGPLHGQHPKEGNGTSGRWKLHPFRFFILFYQRPATRQHPLHRDLIDTGYVRSAILGYSDRFGGGVNFPSFVFRFREL